MRGRRGIVPLLSLLAASGMLIPVLLIIGVALAAVVFGVPAFIGLLISPLKMAGILLLILAGAWLLISRDFQTAAIIGAVGILILLAANAGLLAVSGPGTLSPDVVEAAGPRTVVMRGGFDIPQDMDRQGDYLQFPLIYRGEFAQKMRDACCGRGGPAGRTMHITYEGGFLNGVSRQTDLGLDARLLWLNDAPMPPAGYVRFFDSSGSGNRCPTDYAYEVFYAPVPPLLEGSRATYQLRLECSSPHGLPEGPGASVEVTEQVSIRNQADKAANLIARFLEWLRVIFA